MKDYLNVPVALFEYALLNQRHHEIEIWLFLKFHTEGHFKLTRIIKCQLMAFFNIKSLPTFNKYFNWLLKRKYITFNHFTGNYRLSAFSRVAVKTRSHCYLGAIMYKDDLLYVRELGFSAICANITNQRRRKVKRAVILLGGGRKSRRLSGLVFTSISNGHIATILKKSNPYVSALKSSTMVQGYIKIKKNYSPLNKEINETPVKFGLNERFNIRKYNEGIGPRVRIYNDALYLQEPDSIASLTQLRVIRNLKSLHKSKKLVKK